MEESRDFETEIMEATGFDPELAPVVARAAYLHDIGKASDDFQWFIQNGSPDPALLLAKGQTNRKHRTPGLRHEVHSAVACLLTGESNLVSYLVMAHHGKVRSRCKGWSWVDEEEGRTHGVANGDTLPTIPGVTEAPIEIQQMETIRSMWGEVYREQLDTFGPFKLAEMESLVRNGDVRSSQLHQVGEVGEE